MAAHIESLGVSGRLRTLPGTPMAPVTGPPETALSTSSNDPTTSISSDAFAIETHGLTKRFGTRTALDGIDLRVPRGSAFGFLGPNGAGKTTIIRTLLGLTPANSGTMQVLGRPVPRDRARALQRVGAIVEEPRFHMHLPGRENLRLLAAVRGPETRE